MSSGLCKCGCGQRARKKFAAGHNGLARESVERRDQIRGGTRGKKTKTQERTERWYQQTRAQKHLPSLDALGGKHD